VSARAPVIRVLATGYAVFVCAALVPRLLAGTALAGFFDAHPTAPHFLVKTVLLGFTLVAVRVSGHGWRHFGFQRATGVHWARAVGLGALLGGAATVCIIATPAQGMPQLKSFGLVGLIVSVWFYSSVTEELFVRGWLQSSLESAGHGNGERRALPVLLSGLFFGSLHLSLVPAGADWMTVVILVAATTLLGFQTARLRQRHGSLLPAIAAHVAFNVGGLAAGILINVIAIARTGAPIQP